MPTTPTDPPTPGGTTPCLGCGTKGGYCLPAYPHKPTRVRGLCANCYSLAYYQGTHTDYPDCGPRPIPAIAIHHPDEPIIPRPHPRAPLITWKDADWDAAHSWQWNRYRQILGRAPWDEPITHAA